MGAQTSIEWVESTWNPWIGCSKVSQACAHCYAERWAQRYGWNFSHVARTSDRTFNSPLRWKAPRAVFVCSLSDFFHPDVPPDWRKAAWDIMRGAAHHRYLILTKRPENIEKMLPADWDDGWRHIWLGVTIETQDYAWRWRVLRSVPGRQVKFVSMEPLLGPLHLSDLGKYDERPDWVIAGGESGPGCRSMSPDWVRTIRDSCRAFGVPFFFKQWGGISRINGHWGGNVLDGRVYQEVPSDALQAT